MRQNIESRSVPVRAFVMLNAHLVDQGAARVDEDGWYDPVTQTWKGSVFAQSSTYSTHQTAGGATSNDQTHRRDD